MVSCWCCILSQILAPMQKTQGLELRKFEGLLLLKTVKSL